jgi:high-affinity nickel permease
MELAQIAQQTAGVSLLGTALVLGLRHGIDWDHIAAITDIASTTTAVQSGQAERTIHASPAGSRAVKLGQGGARALWLSLLYALGHASVVSLLGLAALSFAMLLPEWLDPVMERVVGASLLLLGVWVFYSLALFLQGKQELRLQSRWMLLLAGIRHAIGVLRTRLLGRPPTPFRLDQYGPRTAYGIGMIHGIGAETGSQVLIIAAVGGAASQDLGIGLMLAFILGLVLSNTAIALLAATGYITSARGRPFYVAIAAATGLFSLIVGAYFTLGLGGELPDLSQLLNWLGGADPL